MLDDQGRARALKVAPVDWSGGEMTLHEDAAFDIECALIVGATGQAGDFTGLETLDNGRGLMDADSLYRVPGAPGHFVGGDVIEPHLLTTAIGHASIAVEGIDRYLRGENPANRPKVDVHHFNLLNDLRAHDKGPEAFDHEPVPGTDSGAFAVHNYEDRSFAEIIPHDGLYLGHFTYDAMRRRPENEIAGDAVLGNFNERFSGLGEQDAIDEAARCMACGMCFECDNCVIYCPQIAVFRVDKDQRTIGRYVDTDYGKCIGCYICADVCPSGYIQMGLGG